MKISITINPIEESKLKKKLAEMPEKVFKKYVRQASNKAMTPILKDAKRRVPVDTGTLKKSLGRKQKTYSRQHRVWTGVGSLGKSAPHGWLVEHGHRMVVGGSVAREKTGKTPQAKSREITGRGRVVGFVKARPFMVPAFETNKEKALSIYRDALQKAVYAEAKA